MKLKSFLSATLAALLVLTLTTGCTKDKPSGNTNNNQNQIAETTTEERMIKMSEGFEVGLEDYSSYYKDQNITKCLMATTQNIMYSYTEFDTEENAKKKFEEGMSSYKDKITLENKADKYHLYEIQQTLKTSKVENSGTTIDKTVNSKDKDAVNVKYTTYNVREGKVIVSIMAKADNAGDLQKALNAMTYKTK